MNEDKFNKDLEVEEIISLWLEKHSFSKDSNNYQYTRCDIPECQERGIDAALKNLSLFKDDEKDASSYIRTDLETENFTHLHLKLIVKEENYDLGKEESLKAVWRTTNGERFTILAKYRAIV